MYLLHSNTHKGSSMIKYCRELLEETGLDSDYSLYLLADVAREQHGIDADEGIVSGINTMTKNIVSIEFENHGIVLFKLV